MVAKVRVDGKDQKALMEYEEHNIHSLPVISNGKVYYITYNGKGKYNLNSISLDGDSKETIEKDMDGIAGLISEHGTSYYLYCDKENSKRLKKKIDKSGIETTLSEIEIKPKSEIKLHCVTKDYIYYSVDDNIFIC